MLHIKRFIIHHRSMLRIRHNTAGQRIHSIMSNQMGTERLTIKSMNGEFTPNNFPEGSENDKHKKTFVWHNVGYIYCITVLPGFTYQLKYSQNGKETKEGILNMIDNFVNECYQNYGEVFGTYYDPLLTTPPERIEPPLSMD